MRCPECNSATWTDKVEIEEKSVYVSRCFCGWCSTPEFEQKERLLRTIAVPSFFENVVVK